MTTSPETTKPVAPVETPVEAINLLTVNDDAEAGSCCGGTNCCS